MAGKGRPARNRVGERYGRMVVVSRAGINPHKQSLWAVKCDCGSESIKSSVDLGAHLVCSKSCPLGVHVKHGQTGWKHKSKEYATWQDMKRRCYKPESPNYKWYGGRGITVHPDWVDDFPKFLADVGYAPPGHRMSLDRIDNEGNYEPGNVRWATPKEQANNTRRNKK